MMPKQETPENSPFSFIMSLQISQCPLRLLKASHRGDQVYQIWTKKGLHTKLEKLGGGLHGSLINSEI